MGCCNLKPAPPRSNLRVHVRCRFELLEQRARRVASPCHTVLMLDLFAMSALDAVSERLVEVGPVGNPYGCHVSDPTVANHSAIVDS